MNRKLSLNRYFRAFTCTCCLVFVLLSACKKNEDQSGTPSSQSTTPPTATPDMTQYYLSYEFHDTSGQHENDTLVFKGSWWPQPPYTNYQELFKPIKAPGSYFDGKVIRIPVKRDQVSTDTYCPLYEEAGGHFLAGGTLSYDFVYNERFLDTTYHIVLKY